MSPRDRPRVQAAGAKESRADHDRDSGPAEKGEPLRPVAALDTSELLAVALGKGSLAGPARVAEYVQARYEELLQETLGVLYLDSRRRLLGERVLFQGRRFHDSVNPSPILRHGLLLGATGIVLFRTVASDSVALVSPEDRLFAARLGESAEVVGLKLLDLLLVALEGRWASAMHPKGEPAKVRDGRRPMARRSEATPPPTAQEARAAAG